MNSSWFRQCEPNINNLTSNWSREKAEAQVLTTSFIDGEKFASRKYGTVNSSWFRLCEPNINNLKSKWSREIAQAQVLTTDFIEGQRPLLPEMRINIIKYCHYTMTAIQIIQRICIRSKFKQFPRKIGRWTSISKKIWQ